MKRIVSLLVCLALLLSVMTFAATAAETTGTNITEIYVTGTKPTVTLGGTLPELDFAVDPDAPYMIQEMYWIASNGFYADLVEAGDTVEEGFMYRATCVVVPKEGYTLEYPFNFYMNGVKSDNFGFGTNMMDFWYDYGFMTEITSVNVTIEDAVIGAAPAEAVIPEDSAYTVQTNWYDEETWNAVTGVFEDGKNYQLDIILSANPGYQFAPDVEILVNGEPAQWPFVNLSHVSIGKEYRFAEQQIEAFIYADAPMAGMYCSTEAWASWPDAYAVTDVYWTRNGETSRYDGIFEGGNSYTIHITVTPSQGYEIVDVYLSGERCENVESTDNGLVITETYNILPALEEVRISGLKAPVVGQKLPEQDLNVVGDVEILGTTWYYIDENGGLYPAEGIAEDDKLYQLQIDLTSSDPGKTLTYNTMIYMDGESFSWYVNSKGTGEIYVYYSFQDVLDKLDLKGLPATIKAGDPVVIPEITTDSKGARISYVEWCVAGSDGYMPVETPTFEEGKLYKLYVSIGSRGYQITKDTVITTNGVDAFYSKNEMWHDPTGCGMYFDYPIGLKEIERVDFKVTEPKAGVKANTKNITVSTKNVVLKSALWGIADDINGTNADVFEGTFQKNKFYLAVAQATPAEGYYFSGDTQIYVNGKLVGPDDGAVMANHMYVMERFPALGHTHSYKKVETKPTCTEKGYTTYTCSCGDSYVDNDKDALGHDWDNGAVTKAATHLEEGVKTYTCATCKETKTEVIAKIAEHSWNDWEAMDDGKNHTHACECGATETQNHVWSDWAEQDAGAYVRTCADCGATQNMTIPVDKPVNTTPETNAANTNLSNTDIELIEKIFTEEEQTQIAEGAEVKVYLVVEDISEAVPEEDKAAVENAAGQSEVGMYLDIDLFKQVGTADENQITETAGEVAITITIPEELIINEENITRIYKIVRVHEDETGNLITDVIEGEFNPEDHTFTFATDKFSTYALTYADRDDTKPLPTDANIELTRMILGNELAMQFAFQKAIIDEGPAGMDYVVSITKTYADGKEDKTILVPQSEWKTSGSYYYVSFNGIAAKEMGDDIHVQVMTADGTAVGKVYTNSVKNYAISQLRKTTEAKTRTLYVDMLNYGAAAQTYFGYGADKLVTKELTKTEKGYGTKTVKLENNLVKGPGYGASQLNLASSIQLRVKFNGIDSSMYAIVKFTNHNGRVVESRVEGTEFMSGTVVVVDEVVAADFKQDVTITVYDANGTEVANAVESVASYLARQLEKPNALAIYDAVAKYCAAAYGYLHK